jgi:hypothetical protein|tara:strand:+ start:468 stop:980 length:513 start_codon:yes stop_codon:yes gene_type:complete
MIETPEVSLNRPIPGMGMTAEVGSRPWQSPPQYKTVEDALDFYIPRLTEESFNDQLLDVMEMGIPLTTIASSIQLAGVMQGKHTVDVGVLVMPVLIEMMAFIGDDADIEYVTGTEDDKDTDSVSSSKIALAMKAMKERLPEALEQNDSEDIEETPEEIEQPASGLMSRRM